MKYLNVSMITTVYNEEDNIKRFIDSILNMSALPKDFVIVDGGSSDNTYKILKEYDKKYDWIRVYQKKCNIAEGRNIAISKAKYDIIAVTDAGCVLDKNWLLEITNPLVKDKYDIVVGNYINFKKTKNISFLKKVKGFFYVSFLLFWKRIVYILQFLMYLRVRGTFYGY